MLPFSVEQFLGVFKTYNLAIWPGQIVFYLLGGLAVFLAVRPNRVSNRIISAILSFMWLWNGAAYHILSFSRINRAAYVFGLLFLTQGILFAVAGVFRGRVAYRFRAGNTRSTVGLIALAYAMVVYPLLGSLAGHGYPFSPMFGVAPCPTTIFTFGLLLLTVPPVGKYLLIIPLSWSIIGFGAALSLGITEDIGLIVTGVAGTIMLVKRVPSRKTASGAANHGVNAAA